jgi:F-type H+-transporting ATPase subunit delta
MSAFAARYARAFADVVLESKADAASIERELNDFAVTFDGSKDLRELLLNPSLPAARRVSILDLVNRKIGCGKLVRNFLAVLISHERLHALGEILPEFRAEMNRRLLISDAEVVTARAIDADEKAKLERQVAELAGTRVNATFRQDKSLIGGAIVRIGSTIYDGSVRGRLERLKERLAAS